MDQRQKNRQRHDTRVAKIWKESQNKSDRIGWVERKIQINSKNDMLERDCEKKRGKTCDMSGYAKHKRWSRNNEW